MNKYPDNLCNWPWWKRALLPYSWARAENEARSVEWQKRCLEAAIAGEKAPYRPQTIRMR
jgi:hypothetical protein